MTCLHRKTCIFEPHYVLPLLGDWHRVEVTHVDPKTPKITCYFIDHGDEDLFGPEDLRELDPKFLDLAPQAKQVRLAHLEDWNDSLRLVTLFKPGLCEM